MTMTKEPPGAKLETVKIKKTYTTGQVAEILDVAPRTVSKMIDAGLLKGYRIPGSQDRRVHRDQLLKFMIDNKMDPGQIESVKPKILVIGASNSEGMQLARVMESCFQGESAPKYVDSEFFAGVELAKEYHIALIYFSEFGRSKSINMCHYIKSRVSRVQTAVIAMAAEDEDLDSLTMFDGKVKAPFPDVLVGEVIGHWLEKSLTPKKVYKGRQAAE